MKTVRKPRRLICLKCEGEEFAPAEGEVVQEYRGDTLAVRTPVMRCAHCAWETLGPGQVDALRIATADAYRRKHGLLTSGQIRAARNACGLSQRAFADVLGVGQASVPRWESWQVQEAVYDDAIRRFAARAALRPLPTVRVLAEHVRMNATTTSIAQGVVWQSVATAFQPLGPQASLPGLAAYEPRIVVRESACYSILNSDDYISEIQDDNICAHR